MTNQPGPWMTVAEVAHELAVTDRGVRKWIARGVLPAYKVGERAIRIRRTDVEGLITRIPAGEVLA